MSNPLKILSTKVLSPIQKKKIIELGARYTERNFIETEAIPFTYSNAKHTLLFSSQNAVQSVFLKTDFELLLKNKKCYCVGEKTKSALEDKGFKVTNFEENASNLADFILKNAKNEFFVFFCGKERRPDLEAQMRLHKIKLDPIEVYQTVLRPKLIGAFDIVLFYSPSGVRSFLQDNSLKQTVCICIGPTTAEALPVSKRQIIIATSPTIEHMIYQTKKQLPS